MIALITPTGGRQRQFELCAKWMLSQDYKGEVLWVIVDDVVPITSHIVQKSFRENWVIEKVFPEPKWRPGQNTQARNLQAGLDVVKDYGEAISAVFIIEDDDYYTSTYLTQMLLRLHGYLACGEVRTIYVNVKTFLLRKYRNTQHSSLFQTAFVPDLIPIFEDCLIQQKTFIDIIFWRRLETQKNLFISEKPLSIGIKGLDGRPGIGQGHLLRHVTKESIMAGIVQLKQLIGMDYLNYL
jgi:hypothetical protein